MTKDSNSEEEVDLMDKNTKNDQEAGIPRYDTANTKVSNYFINQQINTGKIFIFSSAILLMIAFTFMAANNGYVSFRGLIGFYLLLACMTLFVAGYCAVMDSIILRILSQKLDGSDNTASSQKRLPGDL